MAILSKPTNEVHENKMGTAPILPLIVQMGLPAFISMLAQSLYYVVDTIYVAHLSTEALTALSLAFPVQNLMIAAGTGVAVGVNSLISRRLGEKRQKDAESIAVHGFFIAVAFGLIFALFGFLFGKAFIASFSQNDTVIAYGTDYIRILTIFAFVAMVQIVLEKILQATGEMVWPMICSLVGVILNILLDPLLIFGMWGFPSLETKGAAIATVISQSTAVLLAMYAMHRNRQRITVSFVGFKWQRPIMSAIFAVGTPVMVMQSVGSLMVAGMNFLLAGFSQLAVNVFGVYFKLQNFFFKPIMGINHGLMPVIGYNYGARNKERLVQSIKTATLIGVGIMCLGSLLFLVFPRQLLSLFGSDEAIFDIGISAMRILCTYFPLGAITVIVSAVFPATGHSIYSMMISIIRQLIILLPAAYLLSKISLTAVWWSFLLSEIVASSLCLVFWLRLYRKKIANLT